MKPRLTQYLACPDCHCSNLTLVAFSVHDDEIDEGRFTCGECASQFPIIAGVPRMLPTSMQMTVRHQYPHFFEQYDICAPSAKDGGINQQIQGFFSRQRRELHEAVVSEGSLKRFREELFVRIPAAQSFGGKVGLDAGCGEGRYVCVLADLAEEVIGMDVGFAVDQAYQRSGDRPNVHIVQGSILSPPFQTRIFDFVMSIGVIHHLHSPDEGFQALVPLLRTGGEIHIWVYGLDGMSRVYRASHLRPLRRFTSKMPPALSQLIAVPIGLALSLLVFLPIRLLSNAPAVSKRIHPQLLEIARRPIAHHLAEVHDRIGAPVTHFPSRQELLEWLDRAGLHAGAVRATPGGRGWTAGGQRSG